MIDWNELNIICVSFFASFWCFASFSTSQPILFCECIFLFLPAFLSLFRSIFFTKYKCATSILITSHSNRIGDDARCELSKTREKIILTVNLHNFFFVRFSYRVSTFFLHLLHHLLKKIFFRKSFQHISLIDLIWNAWRSASDAITLLFSVYSSNYYYYCCYGRNATFNWSRARERNCNASKMIFVYVY